MADVERGGGRASARFAVPALFEGLRQQTAGAICTVIISSPATMRAIAFAIEQPADVDINKILLGPTKQEL
ncbi:hypothetical protein [Myxococcus sp. Y35]|uniref:hypothetical protein n=1 Tax=Pseudomyxococcus flavus TaxID=3115648 RepID=UPI003CFA78B4